ncbi:MAG: glycoside hydrolase family 2 TIM barrel-domain containing protein [Oscillospiraceae bacterium]|nr:glycoside hydrolase family 2 TIM barrel-domain containing protein [Oscillospiraceae bacterium]
MLKTRWFDRVDKTCPLPEYPRPQLVRSEWLCLNGAWQYTITDQNATLPKAFDGVITVPFAIESALSGVCRKLQPNEILWYQRDIALPPSFDGKRCILHFGAVDWQCTVYVNGTKVCAHTGGYCPFSADITDVLHEGVNRIALRVYDPTDAGWQNRGKQSLQSHGFWYTGTSGIWQTVWMEPVNTCYVQKLRIVPDIDNSLIHLTTDLSEEAALHAVIRAGESVLFDGDIEPNAHIPLPDPHLWSPEDPFLYDLTVTASQNGKVTDTVTSYFGMRKFSVGNDGGITRLFLNNKPYFQRGLLDQGYYCDGGLTPPCDEAMIYDIQKMKDLGFNMLRKHIKVDLPRWYYHCDRLGMLVWQDMVSGGQYIGNFYAGVVPNMLGAFPRLTPFSLKDNRYKRFSREKPEWRADFERELHEMIDTLFNCVSIYCWVPFNEGWGQFDAKRIASDVKAHDPGRLVDHASGWYDQGAGDIQSMHKYILPIPKIKPDRRAFVISEFGGYSMIADGHVWNKKKSFGYMMFRTKDTLTRAYRRLMEKQIMPLIPKYLSAFIYTQVTDVEFEVNGILTYDREIVKIDEDTIKKLNQRMQY